MVHGEIMWYTGRSCGTLTDAHMQWELVGPGCSGSMLPTRSALCLLSLRSALGGGRRHWSRDGSSSGRGLKWSQAQ